MLSHLSSLISHDHLVLVILLVVLDYAGLEKLQFSFILFLFLVIFSLDNLFTFLYKFGLSHLLVHFFAERLPEFFTSKGLSQILLQSEGRKDYVRKHLHGFAISKGLIHCFHNE